MLCSKSKKYVVFYLIINCVQLAKISQTVPIELCLQCANIVRSCPVNFPFINLKCAFLWYNHRAQEISLKTYWKPVKDINIYIYICIRVGKYFKTASDVYMNSVVWIRTTWVMVVFQWTCIWEDYKLLTPELSWGRCPSGFYSLGMYKLIGRSGFHAAWLILLIRGASTMYRRVCSCLLVSSLRSGAIPALYSYP